MSPKIRFSLLLLTAAAVVHFGPYLMLHIDIIYCRMALQLEGKKRSFVGHTVAPEMHFKSLRRQDFPPTNTLLNLKLYIHLCVASFCYCLKFLFQIECRVYVTGIFAVQL